MASKISNPIIIQVVRREDPILIIQVAASRDQVAASRDQSIITGT